MGQFSNPVAAPPPPRRNEDEVPPSRVLNQSKNSIISKKSVIFALSLKQMSSSSFHMFIYARSEQCDFGPIYTITNMQHIRIYPGKLKSIPVKFHLIQDVSLANMPKKTNSINVSYYSEFIWTPLFTGVQMGHIQICPVML